MDSVHSHPATSQPTSTVAHATDDPPPTISSSRPRSSKRYSEPTTNKQKRLLQSRNARFPTKKLSLTTLGSRFSQLIHANDEPLGEETQDQDQENIAPETCDKEESGRKSSLPTTLGIFDEITNAAPQRRPKRDSNFPIYQDTPERPLLQRSPFSSPALYQDCSSKDASPVAFDHIQDSLGAMRLREISGNEFRGSPLASSPLNGTMKMPRKRASVQVKAGFDTQEYIEHIERQLQEAKNEMYSPTTNKSLKDQLQAARYDNERLRQEMAEMRDLLEAEVKRTIEVKAGMEAEFKRQVRDLEDVLDQKTAVIKDLELQHDERRLDSNTIDTLKAAIDKLEQDKLVLEDENRSVSKRNEVLSELLAMSPNKLQSFELRSPTREKRRAARPMSMIIPRLPSSPTGRQISQPTSAVASPALSACGPFFSPVKSQLGSPQLSSHGLGLSEANVLNLKNLDCGTVEPGNTEDGSSRGRRSRRSTLQSQASLNDAISIVSTESLQVDPPAQRTVHKRKPRKFMAGSTQLKPLLLPALAGDSLPPSASSLSSSPRLEATRQFFEQSIDPTTCFLSQPDHSSLDDTTILVSGSPEPETLDLSDNGVSPVHHTVDEIMAEHRRSIEMEQEYSTTSDLGAVPLSESGHALLLEDRANVLIIENFHNPVDPKAVWQSDRNRSPMSYDISSETSSSQFLRESRSWEAEHCTGLDMKALSQLQLPEPSYDAMPVTGTSAEEVLNQDVPRPLFSLEPYDQGARSRQDNRIMINHQHSQTQHKMPHVGELHFQCPTFGTMLVSPALESPSWSPRQCKLAKSPDSIVSDRSQLPQRATLKPTDRLMKTKSPVDILRLNSLGPRPLAALTIRTIFGTISRCTAQIRDLKRDPLALARRVIANAWFSHWKKFGRFSWWILGLFISTGLGGPKLKEWQWDHYDAESIAQKVCHESRHSTSSEHVEAIDSSTSTQEATLDCPPESSETKQKTGWGKSVLLWGKFSVAIMMAVGGAVVKGPGEMLKDIEDRKEDEHGTCNCQLEDDSVKHSNHRSHHTLHPSLSEMHPRSWSRKRYKGRSASDASAPRSGSVFENLSSSFDLAGSNYNIRDDRNSLGDGYEAADETLKASRSPRKRLADYFQRHDSGQSILSTRCAQPYAEDDCATEGSDCKSIHDQFSANADSRRYHFKGFNMLDPGPLRTL